MAVLLAAKLVVAFVAVEHVGFALLEMVFWARPIGIKVFGTTEAFARESASLAKNQGLYNLFLVAGLAWSLVAEDGLARPLRIFFLGCVVVAGVFGALTVSWRILLLQAAPGALGLALALAS